MKYEKIRGKSVAECMMKLRSTYGSQAIILSTREVQEGGLLGSGLFSRKQYEIDFMLQENGSGLNGDAPPLARPRVGDRSSLSKALFAAAREREGQRQPPPAAVETSATPESKAPPLPVATSVPANPIGSGSAGVSEGEIPPLSALHSPEEAALERQALDMLLAESAADFDRSQRAAEFAAADDSNMQAPRVETFTSGPVGGMEMTADEPMFAIAEGDERFSRILERIRGQLLQSQVSGEFADRFLQSVDNSLSRNEREEYRRVERRSLEQLAGMIRTVTDIAPRPGECQAVMLFGPTGSGKTTSLAKLAARYHIMQGRDVSIYSLDHYRLAATEQLKTYAGVMDVPFYAPLSPEDFTEYLRRDGAELMLIDTSGIGYRDEERLEQLQAYVNACEVRLEKHLVLAANTNAGMLEKILLAYDQIGLDKIILTKLDETDFLGAFIELADKYNRPFSFLMNGQDVPGSILEAESRELARMVLSGSTETAD